MVKIGQKTYFVDNTSDIKVLTTEYQSGKLKFFLRAIQTGFENTTVGAKPFLAYTYGTYHAKKLHELSYHSCNPPYSYCTQICFPITNYEDNFKGRCFCEKGLHVLQSSSTHFVKCVKSEEVANHTSETLANPHVVYNSIMEETRHSI